VGTSDCGNEPLGFHKMGGISLLAASQLPSQEGY
jgi:hypothetical protein